MTAPHYSTIESWDLISPTINKSHKKDSNSGHLKKQVFLNQYFEEFFNIETLSSICDLTNNSVSKYKTKHPLRKTRRLQDWKQLDIKDLKKYLGLVLMMGIDKKPTIRKHWDTEGLWQSSLISQSMTLNRFEGISKYLQVGTGCKYEKLAKLKTLSDHFSNVSTELYEPCRKISLDESLIGFNESHSGTSKSAKYRFKAFLICESRTGFCLSHSFYTDENKEDFKAYKISIKLLEKFSNSGFHVYADSWYTSVKLVKSLKELNIEYTGAIKSTAAGIPDKKSISKLLKDNVLFLQYKELLLVYWKDKKLFSILSNTLCTELEDDEHCIDGFIPTLVRDYRMNMGGVDRFDQKISYYLYPHSFRKRWKYHFLFLVELAVNNSFILYKLATRKKISYLDYRIEIIKRLVLWKVDQGLRVLSCEDGVADEHELKYLNDRKNCAICRKNGKRSSCHYFCKLCKRAFHLECFLKFHQDRIK